MGMGSEIADIISAFMTLVVIFALIFAASGDWTAFITLVLVGSVMMFFSNLFRARY